MLSSFFKRVTSSSLCQRGHAYSLETMAVESKGLLQTQNKKREVEKREGAIREEQD